MTKLFWIVLGVPVGIVLITLGVANREPLAISLDPFRPGNPALSIHPPLFIAFFVVLGAGVLIGGIATWISHYKVRRALHRSRMDVQRLQQECDRLVAERGVVAATGRTSLAGPRRVA